MLIEMHMIQNHSPSNLNRDDLGAPKTCLFGGVTRARISSQCLKRSIRSPGNPDDIHNRQAGLFATGMAGHIGTRTKFFPWLVGQALLDSPVPPEEHRRIVLAAQRIAQSSEKEEKAKRGARDTDGRPRTPQLIHLGPGHARFFVAKLAELREQRKEQYEYFLHPEVGFKEMVRQHPDVSVLDEKEQNRIVKASWVVAKCRMADLLKAREGEEAEPEPPMEDDQPGDAHAALVAQRLAELRLSDPDRLKALAKAPSKGERGQLKDSAPDRPKKMEDFYAALKIPGLSDAVDIALFGRMTTSDAFEDVEAAMQVAHAISTHAVVNEVDYFTAVDDLGRGPQAGHLGETQYNSACFYKYFCLDWEQLVSNLAGPQPDPKEDPKAHAAWTREAKPNAEKLAACALGHFLRAAALTTPSGKQNSFASHCDACGILVEIRKTRTPTSYANAFAEPVERIGKPDDDAPDEKSIEGRSVACLADHVHAIGRTYGLDSTLLWYSPKLWRFPLQYWEREEGGKKTTAMLVTDRCFDVLGGEAGRPEGLVEAVLQAVGFEWSEVKDAAKAPTEEA